MKDKKKSYFGEIKDGMSSLLTGLGVTWKEYFTKKVTEQYPENRKTEHISERHRAILTMPHDENGVNKCVACELCQKACPNGTITVLSQMVVKEDGKKKKLLTDYVYDLGDCMFCNLCVDACPHDAIRFSNNFENSVFDRNVLVQHLNIPPTKEAMEQYEANAKRIEEEKAAAAAAKAAENASTEKTEETK